MPAGWHPDPLGRTAWRYWDGNRWTPHASPDGSTVVADGDPTLPDPVHATGDPNRALALLASVVTIALVAAVAVWQAGEDEGSSAFAVDTPRPDTAEVDNPTPAPTGDEPADTPLSPMTSDPDRDAPATEGDESPWPVSGEPLKVVYLTETSSGDEWEEIVASDPPRSIQRTPSFTLFNDGTDVVQCIEDRCVLQDDEWAEAFDYLQSRVGFPPSPQQDPFTRRLIGRDAVCTGGDGTVTETVTCWDSRTGILLLLDPGDEAMAPSAFTSTRITATYLGPPDESDFDLPSEVLPPENR